MIDALIKQFTDLPRKGTPACELTERDKLALCLAAGVPSETNIEGTMLNVKLTVPCGVADRGDGGYIIAIGKNKDCA